MFNVSQTPNANDKVQCQKENNNTINNINNIKSNMAIVEIKVN